MVGIPDKNQVELYLCAALYTFRREVGNHPQPETFQLLGVQSSSASRGLQTRLSLAPYPICEQMLLVLRRTAQILPPSHASQPLVVHWGSPCVTLCSPFIVDYCQQHVTGEKQLSYKSHLS